MKRSCVGVCIVLAITIMSAALASSARALVPDGAQGWYWQMPQPVGAQLDAVAFPTADALWAVGAGGAILHSTDAGATWAPQSSNTTAELTSVSFVDDQHGWVCGRSATGAAAGVILATGNGGTTWSNKTPAVLADLPTNVSFVDATHGWVGTDKGGVLKTSDGGDTWRRLRIGAYKGYVLVDFVDNAYGWAVGTRGHLWRTTNGGAKWTSQKSGLARGLRILQVDFYDRDHGWAVVFSSHGGLRWVFSTSDGGSTWQRRLILKANEFATGIQATGVASAWLASVDFSAFFSFSIFAVEPFAASVYHTTDGGAHWQASSLGASSTGMYVASHGDRVCAVGDRIFTSGDAGSTWASATSGQRYSFRGAAAVSASDIWAVEGGGALLHSIDGARWVEQPVPVRWSKTLYGVSFPDAQDGWVVGTTGTGPWDAQGVILHTSDGGQTWNHQTSNLSGELTGVDFVDAQNGWAISDFSDTGGSGAPLCLEHTTDGGATWIPQYVINNPSLTAVDFLSDTTGWVAGEYQVQTGHTVTAGRAIFATTNGGTTWTMQALPKGAPLMTGLQFLDADNGWAVGASYGSRHGWVLHTTDGGTTWARVSGLDDVVANTVHFTDATHGWLAGNGVYATTDGGATWQRVASGNNIWAMAAVDPQHAWAFGDGLLLSTVDASGDTAAPSTIDTHPDSAWHNKPVTITLSTNDIGGSEPVSTQYSTDGGLTWQTGTSISVDAPANHSGDGQHAILYRSTDAVGNREATQIRSVGIDTLGPTCTAPKKAVVGVGKQGIIRFKAADDTSGVARVTINIVNARGRVVRSFVERSGNWSSGGGIPYFWLRFTCRLKPGTYGIEVRAVDLAGNSQTRVGRNTLRVVAGGAPRPQHPPWPSGLGKAGRRSSAGSRGLGLRLAGFLSPRLAGLMSSRLRSATAGIL